MDPIVYSCMHKVFSSDLWTGITITKQVLPIGFLIYVRVYFAMRNI